MSVSAIKKQQRPPSDPLRGALVDALADLAAAKQQVENHKAATRRCWSAITAAQANAAKAEKGIAAARVDAAAVLADVAVDDDGDVLVPPPNTVALAIAAHADALETIENLRAAREQLRRTLPDLEADVRAADAVVDAKISEILLPVAADLIVRLEKLIREAMPIRELLSGLIFSHSDRDVPWYGRRALEPQLDAAGKLTWAHSIGDVAVADGPWKAARQRLREDPLHADIDDLVAPAPSLPPAA